MSELIQASPLVWAVSIAIIIGLLAIDLGVFHRSSKEQTFREACYFCVTWFVLAAMFNLSVWWLMGSEKALEFVAGYLVEQSLSIDNIFLFILIFSHFKVPERYRHRLLFYGVLGAIIMRGIFIWLGIELIQRFHFVIFAFGALLLFTAWRMLVAKESDHDIEDSAVLRIARKYIPGTPSYHEQRFFVRQDGKLLATPLFFVLVVIEATDLVFAIDSIPAVLAITTDPFIVFTSNVFAILGLRSLFFVLSSGLAKLRYLKYGLSLVLAFVGMKMMLADVYKIPTFVSLLVIAVTIAVTVAASLIYAGKKKDNVQF